MTEPYYADDAVTLFLGSCLEVTDWLSADVLVTDPPYGIAWQLHVDHRPGKRRSGTVKHDGIKNDGDTTARDGALALWAEKPGLVFGAWSAPFPKSRQVLVWKKPSDTGVIGSTTGYRRDSELIFLTGSWPARPAGRSSVIQTEVGKASYLNGNGHPHAKPVGLMGYLIEWTAGVIADPFAGSGSTLVAAKALGRKAIGVEIEERYCEIAARRLSQGVLDFNPTMIGGGL